MSVHMRLNGSWAPCKATERVCPRLFHLPAMSLPEARQLPAAFLAPLLEVLDPPDDIEADGMKVWRDREGQLHRDHDLPAVVSREGHQAWYRHGQLHRAGGRPARITEDGKLSYWVDGEFVYQDTDW